MAFNSGLAKAISRLGRLQKSLDELSLVPIKVAQDAALGINVLIARQFATGSDPYGKHWKPIKASALKRRTNKSSPPLTDRGRLSSGTIAEVMPGGRRGVRLVIGAPYGYFAQVGTKHAPARPIFPTRGLPASWRAVLKASFKAQVKAALR